MSDALETPSNLTRESGDATEALTLRCEKVSKHFGGVKAVREVSMEFAPRVITGVIGANGAGKSTLVDLLTGVQSIDSGATYLNEINISRASPARRVRLGMGRTFQHMRLFGGMTAEENVMACLPRIRNVGLVKGLFEGRTKLIRELRHDANDALETVGARPLAGTVVDDLSYGDQKLVAVARVVASGARVLLLDEPFAGLDDEGVERLSQIIRELTSAGRTVGIIDHHVDAMVSLVHTMYVMNFGEVLASGDPSEVMSNPAVRAAYLGRE